MIQRLLVFVSVLFACSAFAQFSVSTDTNGVLALSANKRSTNFFSTNMTRFMRALKADPTWWPEFINSGQMDLGGSVLWELHTVDYDYFDTYFHMDVLGGGSDGRAGAYSGDPLGTTIGTNNPNLISRIGVAETLFNKTIVSPTLAGTVSGDFTFDGNIEFTGSANFNGSTISNAQVVGLSTAISMPSSGGANSALLVITFPGGAGGSGTNPVMVISINTNSVDSKQYVFGTWNDANQVMGLPWINTNEVARLGDLWPFISQYRGIASGLVPLDSGGKIPYTNFPNSFPLTNIALFNTNYLTGNLIIVSSSYNSLVDSPGENKAIDFPTNDIVEFSGASAIADLHSFATRPNGTRLRGWFSGAVTNRLVINSGSEGTTTRRIYDGKGGTGRYINMTNSPSWADFEKRSSGWFVTAHSD